MLAVSKAILPTVQIAGVQAEISAAKRIVATGTTLSGTLGTWISSVHFREWLYACHSPRIG
jgi:hypothetical protein